MQSLSRRRFVAAAGLASLAGCSGGWETSNPGTTPAGTRTPNASSAIPTADERLPLPMSPAQLREKAVSGGPPKDGIPSIDEPRFVPAAAVDYLDPGDPVFGVVRDGVVKAYPQKILVHHEIVNDAIAGTPVSVTYCPLTGTVLGFERGRTTFGVSGRLINNNLVMYDRATEAWWPQMLATAIPGPWNESPRIRTLREFRLIWTTWGRWTDQHPATRVLSTNTGSARNYGNDPYGSYDPLSGYYADDSLLFPALHADGRYETKTVFMCARAPDGAVAFRKESLRTDRLMSGTLGDTPVLAVYDARYDTAYIYSNPDGVTVEMDDGAVVTTDGTRHAPDEVPLPRLHTFDAMWFAWVGFYPETNVYE
ncbi:MAG: DUF3179 domain-containing protein [Haloplanus sp.]